MPVMMAKARARITAIFVMGDLPSSARLPEQGKHICDCHHVLELFRKKKGHQRVA
jgi:hypothetical protein